MSNPRQNSRCTRQGLLSCDGNKESSGTTWRINIKSWQPSKKISPPCRAIIFFSKSDCRGWEIPSICELDTEDWICQVKTVIYCTNCLSQLDKQWKTCYELIDLCLKIMKLRVALVNSSNSHFLWPSAGAYILTNGQTLHICYNQAVRVHLNKEGKPSLLGVSKS